MFFRSVKTSLFFKYVKSYLFLDMLELLCFLHLLELLYFLNLSKLFYLLDFVGKLINFSLRMQIFIHNISTSIWWRCTMMWFNILVLIIWNIMYLEELLVQMTTIKQSKMNWMASLHPCWIVIMNSQAQPKRSIITP